MDKQRTQHVDAEKLLQSIFGYQQFRGHQREIIDTLSTGDDALVLMPTGGGKSLCYQIPAMLRDGVGIVISPLIALMQDQVNSLLQLGVNAAYINSSQNYGEIRDVEQALLNNSLDLLYIAPERLTAERTLALFKKIPIALFAVDEAHCVSQWGHDFRADYLLLSMLHEQFPGIPRIALTATADERTRQEIILRLQLQQAKVFISGFDRPNIQYRIIQKNNARKQLLQFIRAEHAEDAGIVYCLSRKKVEATAQWLVDQGLNALPYHAGLPAQTRSANQHHFLVDEGVIMVATIAFGMGIDKPNVRFVAHLDLPKSIEAYYQETGRAGRDGLPANAWMSYGLQDVITLRQMLNNSDADEKHRRIELYKLDAMLGLCEQIHCRRQVLLNYFGETLTEPCGNCDTCNDPVATWDGTQAAQQALSCIYRTGQRFGVNYLIDVLLGRNNERIKQFGHERVSTYGIGKALDETQWRSVFRQLVARNLATVDLDGYGALHLAESCRSVLKGEEKLMLRRDLKPAKVKRERSNKAADFMDSDKQLWKALTDKRSEIAHDQDVPPYIIFHDATLMEMVAKRPQSLQQMMAISGVGNRKLEKYGDDFLAVIQNTLETSSANNSIFSETVTETLDLFRIGYSVEKIAEHRGLKITTIYGHLSEIIENGEAALNDVVNLQENEIEAIQKAFLALPEEQKQAIKPVFDSFDSRYDYGVLRCVRAALYKTEVIL